MDNFRDCGNEFYDIMGSNAVDEVTEKALSAFKKRFDYLPERAACAPGRVNLIGEHTDYNDGFVFPMVRLFHRYGR